MGLFSFTKNKERFGIIIDVGSGSVLTAIVHSETSKKHPTIVWAHREHIALKKIDSVQHSAKAVLAALMNASLKLESEGRSKLQEIAPKAQPSSAQCSIAAPWSYTVTKTINVNQEEAFKISKTFIQELIETAQRQVQEELKSHTDLTDVNLTVIAKATMDMLTNGYRVAKPEGENASSLFLTEATVVSQQYIIDGIKEIQQKLFPNAEISSLSFILMLYCTVRSLHPELDDVCLVDITDEASEIGIVRDGSLKYSTHTPFGMFSLAREISEVTSVPLHEALGHLQVNNIQELLEHIPTTKHDEITKIFESYVLKLADLLNETGDSLSIPKKILLHVEASHVALFSFLIDKAARRATKIEHIVDSLTDEVIPKKLKDKIYKEIDDYANDTALIVNAEFFHKQHHCLDFNYS